MLLNVFMYLAIVLWGHIISKMRPGQYYSNTTQSRGQYQINAYNFYSIDIQSTEAEIVCLCCVYVYMHNYY